MDQVLEGVQDSPLFNRTMAALQQHVGDVYRELGRTEEAQSFYENCRAIVETMARENHNSDANIFNMAVVYEKLGDVSLELEDLGVARDFHEKSLQCRQQLSRMKITDPHLSMEKVKESLANAYSKQSSLALMLGDPSAAWEFLSHYLELHQLNSYSAPQAFLADLAGGKLEPKYERVAFLLKVGEISFRLGDVATCRTLYERAFNRSRAALERAPERVDARDAMAMSAGAMGDLHLTTGEAQAATPYYATSHELIQARAAKDPDNAVMQRTLSFSHYRFATASLANGDSEAARRHYEECLTLRKKLADADQRNAHKQIDLMVALARCGQHAEAATVAAQLGDRASQDPSVLFQIACGYSLCSAAVIQNKSSDRPTPDELAQQEEYAEKAVRAIEEAIAKGYRDVVALQADPDLQPIQQREDFKSLLRTMKMQ
jgi:tetratricopeptide (TPR) repeat protein